MSVGSYFPLGRASALFEASRSNRRSLMSLIVGLVVGFCMAEMFMLSRTPDHPEYMSYSNRGPSGSLTDAHNSHELLGEVGPENDVGSHEHQHENITVSQKLYKEVRVLCWIMTNPDNHKSKALHVKRTWGKRCNKLLIMSSKKDKELGTIALPVHEGRNNLWAKTKEAFKYIYKHHMDDADWFFKADDDTYAVMENLRYMLYPYSPETPVYFGCKFKPFVKQGYMSGGAGYVLSKEAVRRFVTIALPNPNLCRSNNEGAEDVEMGHCLENVKVMAGDSRDSHGRGRFFPLMPEHHLLPAHKDPEFWYWQYVYYETENGIECCSDNAISFHYVPPNQMYVMDYLIYHLRPYGIVNTPEPLLPKLRIGSTPKTIDTSSETSIATQINQTEETR